MKQNTNQPVHTKNVSATIVAEQTISEKHSGPIPHPEIMRGYSSINPSFPERIMKMAERNNDASIEHEEYLIKETLYIKKLGTILSFIIGLMGIIAGVICGIMGLSAAAITAILGGISPVLIASISGIRGSNKNGARQSKDINQN